MRKWLMILISGIALSTGAFGDTLNPVDNRFGWRDGFSERTIQPRHVDGWKSCFVS
jgi:hypothetical protein